MRAQIMKEEGKKVPCNNVGRQSDPNVRRTLVHVGPTMGGVVTVKILPLHHPLCSSLTLLAQPYDLP